MLLQPVSFLHSLHKALHNTYNSYKVALTGHLIFLCRIVPSVAQTSPPLPSLCRIVAPVAQTSPPLPSLCRIVAPAAQTSPPLPSLCRIVAPAAQTSPPLPSLCRIVAPAAQSSQRHETLCSNGSDYAHNLSGVGKWDISGNYLTIICVIIDGIRQSLCIKFINFIPDFFNKKYRRHYICRTSCRN